MEDESHSTLEDLLFSARLLRQMNASRIVVVSDRYHLARATLCFRFLGFEAKGSGPDRGKTGTPLMKWLYYYLREIAAIPYYLIPLILLATRRQIRSKG